MQRIKEGLGLTQVSVDSTFDKTFEQVKNLASLCEAICKQIAAHINSFKTMLKQSGDLSSEFRAFYESSGMQTSARSSQLITVSGQWDDTNQQLSTTKLSMYSAQLHDNVVQPLERWLVDLNALIKRCQSDRLVSRQKFDHYRDKLAKLQSDFDKAELSGKSLPQREIDRLTRNRSKFATAKQEFDEINAHLTEHLQAAWNQRHRYIDPVFAQVCGHRSVLEVIS